MKKRKKFDGGGSVMDKPSRDMRDPAYRRQLEREQALETSAPELAFVGPAKAAQAGFATKMMGRAATPTRSVTENVQIGQYVKRNEKIADAVKEHMLSKAAPGERAAVARKIEENLAKARTQDERAKNFGAFQNAVLDAETGLVKSLGTPLGVEAIKRLKERSTQESSDRYKKGGRVSSASSRADGIAIRGKTRGTMR